jgi:hypothetical protein
MDNRSRPRENGLDGTSVRMGGPAPPEDAGGGARPGTPPQPPQPPPTHDAAAEQVAGVIVPRDADLADLQAERGRRLLVDLDLGPTVPGPCGPGACACYGLLPRRQPPRARKRRPLVITLMTPKPRRRRPQPETPEKLKGVQGFLKGAARNASGDVEVLPLVAALHDDVDQALAEVVRQARELGHSWDQIGQRLGMARQNVWRRFGP